MPPFGWFELALALYIVWVIGACASLLMNRRSPQATLAWMFAFIALPVVSGIYYLVFGPRRLHRRRIRYKIARGLLADDVSAYLRSSCAPGAPQLSVDAAALAGVGKRLGQGMPTFASRIELHDGDDYFEALGRAIAAADHHVHMEYYIWEPDDVGTRIRNLLIAARERDVRVRVLCDAVGSPNAGKGFWAPLREAGGDVRIFNRLRFSPARINFANFRTHRKIAVCDGATGFLGGMNLHDPASQTRSGKDAWRDQTVRIEGEPIRRLQRIFLENWIYSGGNFMLTPDNLARYFPPFNLDSRILGADGQHPVQILASGPDDDRVPLHAFFMAAISTARSRVWIETPYLIPDEPLESAMRVAELRGVDVQVIVPRRGDSRLVTAASHTYCESLGKAGVVVHEYGPPMLHAKTLIVDSTVAVVGTANMDNRSFRLNFEVAAVLYDPATIAALAKRFEADRAASRRFSARNRSPRFTTLLESIARLTSPVL
jgi:cardiolipin synthase